LKLRRVDGQDAQDIPLIGRLCLILVVDLFFVFVLRFPIMTNHSVQDCHMLKDASNFVPWKCKVQNLLEEVELWFLVEKEVVLPTNPKDLAKHNRKSIKAKQIILDLVKDHLIPHIAEKKTTKEMQIALVTL
jgi:hypothetical protein